MCEFQIWMNNSEQTVEKVLARNYKLADKINRQFFPLRVNIQV